MVRPRGARLGAAGSADPRASAATDAAAGSVEHGVLAGGDDAVTNAIEAMRGGES